MKEIDCKIIEDLILPYIEETLNEETRDLVEKHLQNCNKCKHKVEEFKSNIIENKDNDKKCIDYLKKAKRKERIRTIKWIIFAILVVFIFIYLRNFIILNDIYNKQNKLLSHNNIYIQQIEHEADGSAIVTKYYFKDGNFKKSSELYMPDNSISTIGRDIYSTGYTTEDFASYFPSMTFNSGIIERVGHPLITSVFGSIKTKDLVNGPKYDKCFVLSGKIAGSKTETWYDKKTGLIIQEVQENTQKSYYPSNSNENAIWKYSQDRIVEYYYEYDIVTDEDVTNSKTKVY